MFAHGTGASKGGTGEPGAGSLNSQVFPEKSRLACNGKGRADDGTIPQLGVDPLPQVDPHQSFVAAVSPRQGITAWNDWNCDAGILKKGHGVGGGKRS